MDKKQNIKKTRAFKIKLLISGLIVLSALVLKTISPDLSDKIANMVNGNINYEEVATTVGNIFTKEEAVEVFEDENDKKPPQDKEKEDESAIEALSFDMSKEELQDDTKAEVFKIPPPSYCSYDKIEIPFSYTSPLKGRITSKYGYRDHPVIEDASFHTGIDIGAKSGVAVACFADGTVLEAKYNDTYGNYLLIEHAGGVRSFYGHNSKLMVKRGAKVKKGQKIAEVGTTGLSTGPHLHFEVRNGSKRLDPTHYIKV